VVGWYHENSFPLIAVGRQRRQLFATEGLFGVIRPLADVHFDGFGACVFRPRTKPPTEEVLLPADLAAKRKLVRQQSPTVPGVYGMLDPQGELIYVGKSKALRDRLLSYCSESEPESKSRRIMDRAARLLWEVWPDEFAALLRELELIRRWRPRFNVLGQPGRLRRTYVCLGRGPAPYAYLASEPSPRAEWFFGPLPGVSRWHQTVRRLNDCFLLRDCSDRVPIIFLDQRQLFLQERVPACLRYDLGTCLGPCAGRATSHQYADRVHQAAEFLRGNDLSVLAELQQAMAVAAAMQQFERAATIRDAWTELTRLHGQLRSLRDAQQHYSFVYPLAAYHGRVTWYFVRQGRVIASSAAPNDRRKAARCQHLLEQVYAPDRSSGALPGQEDLDVLLLVAGWFRHHPDQLPTTLTPRAARQLCRKVLKSGE
jgi:excinuclease ABC subunit C